MFKKISTIKGSSCCVNEQYIKITRTVRTLYPLHDLIETIDGGYSWNSVYEYECLNIIEM
ncbi:hypothetical protein [Neobacillus niacini]|uniref:hypothetical protein n=1 Tax=Neobacillus niacini TaxID=86668 RepID=UPI002856CDBC|nr:hypothetical protein [Neobacillus niacini]MDR7002988.1 hypothetical protein [Neobacillus niacini]